MKGTNELNLNETTMIEAVQEYLNKRMSTYAPTVTSVKAGRNISDYSFTIIVTDPTPV